MMPTILTGAAGRALRTLTPLSKPTGPLEALKLVNTALPDMVTALGADRGRTLGKAMFDASRRGSTRTAASREQIRLGLDELTYAADATASKRLLIGGLGAVAGISGARFLHSALQDHGSDDRIWAPGPLGEQPAPERVQA